MVDSSKAPASAAAPQDRTLRSPLPAMLRGARGRCPNCGEGGLFAGWLAVAPACTACGLDFSHHRADDAPPYFTMLIAGHLVIPPLLAYEVAVRPPLWQHMLIFGTGITVLSVLLLRPIKGAIVGLQWSQYMHGFELGHPPAHGARLHWQSER